MGEKKFERVWYMCDYARQRIFVREEFLLWLDALQRLGYNGIGLYLEGAFEFTSIPGVIREGVMTREDAAWAMEEGKRRGMLVFPMTNVVGHMEHFFHQERFSDLLMDNTNLMQMDFLDPRAEEFAMQIVHEYTSAFPCGLIHIGGDETTLTEENKMLYAQFLAKICRNLLDEGIQPAIWDDMLWMDPEMCSCFDRRTFIFDWNYYGHRPESIAFFKELGFQDMIVCPCDNSWEGFINYQRLTGYLKARMDMPIKPDEVEAFFEDARNQNLLSGFLTNWENTAGRNMWAQWVPIARSGLYMNGHLPAGSRDDTAIEMALFGRITPYTEITYALQEEIQRSDILNDWFHNMRNMLFNPKLLPNLLKDIRKENADFFLSFPPILAKLQEKLDAWVPRGAFETNCAAAMAAVLAQIQAATAVATALHGYTLYAQAARIQFAAPAEAVQLLEQVADSFRLARSELQNTKTVLAAAILPTGHTTNDLMRLELTADTLEKTAELLLSYSNTISRIPLPRFDRIIDSAAKGTFLF